MKEPLIQINDFKGGMSLNEKLGREDMFHIGKGLDFFSKEGYLTTGYAWRNMKYADLEALPTEFNWMVFANKDGKNYFGGEDAKIYRQLTSTTLELVRTLTASIRGMAEFKDCLYYAQDTTLGRFDFTTWTDSWQTLISAPWHPIIIQALKLYIGNGRYLASYDGTTWNANALDLDIGWTIRCLAPYGLMYIAIGANFGNVKCKIPLWDRVSSSWVDEISIPENIIQAMWFDSGYLWVIAGTSGNIYVVPEGSRRATKVWSFTKENPLQDINVFPGAITSRKGTMFIGLSDVDFTSALKNPAGIYSFPVEPEKFKINIPFKNLGYKERYKSLALMGATNTLYASFRNYAAAGSEYNNLKRERNVDEADPYRDIVEYESFCFKAPKNKKILTEKFGILCDPLPEGVNLSLYCKKDKETAWTSIFTNFSTTGEIEKKVDKILEANRLKLKLELRGSLININRPYVDSIYITGDVIGKQ